MSVFAGAVKSEPADGNGSTSFGTVTEGSAAAVLSGGSGKIDTRDEYSRSYGALSRQYAKKILDRVEFYETLHRLVSVCESEYRQRMDKVPLERPVRLPDWWISRRHDDVRVLMVVVLMGVCTCIRVLVCVCVRVVDCILWLKRF